MTIYELADYAHKLPNVKLNKETNVVSVVFFKVTYEEGEVTADQFTEAVKAHKGAHVAVNLFDGKEHNYLELGAWADSQDVALRIMALGKLLGVWELLTPYSVLGDGLDESTAQTMAGMGYVMIRAKN